MDITVQDVFGMVGTIMVIAAYLMLQLGRVVSQDLVYSLLNAVGAALILYSLCYDFNLAAVVIESFWILISFIGILNYIRMRDASRHAVNPTMAREDHDRS